MADNDRCLAPVFPKNNVLACVYLAIIYTVVVMLLIISLVWLSAQGRCLIRQYLFRIRNCAVGNSDPNLPI